MIFKRIPILLCAALCCLFSCSKSESPNAKARWTDSEAEHNSSVTIPPSAVPGRLIVKLDEEYSRTKGASSLDLSSLGSYNIRRTFRDAGRFEARHRKSGLHLWYTIDFEPNAPMSKAIQTISKLEGVEHIDFDFTTKINIWNDPLLANQWHFHNEANVKGMIAGSDINVLKAWSICAGNPNVTVAVLDGGVEYYHADLMDNMWVNPYEIPEDGIDNDENGYIDDVFGYNFCVKDEKSNTAIGKIQPTNHGTHVAGIIAAASNNDKGVAGIAGGNGTIGSGVKILTVQTNDDDDHGSYIGEAICYAADMGAVLMNCSWCLKDPSEFPKYLKDAIDYFNTHAGMDEDGKNQVGPMAGGVIFFAAGNENIDTNAMAAYENVVAVAGIGANYKKAYYSNYGPWVDIAAPGGDENFNIASTGVDNTYIGMVGTSMACPHVTGVAALIASYFGGDGFTREQLINILLSTTRDISSYNKTYKGQLGKGLVDAYAALTYTSSEEPAPISEWTTAVINNSILLNWIMPGGSAGKKPSRFNIFYSKKSLSALDPKNPGEDVQKVVVDAGDVKVGWTMSYRIENLEFGATYYLRINTETANGISSPLCEEIKLEIAQNSPPVITPLNGLSAKLGASDKGALRFRISDKDKHTLSYDVSCIDEIEDKLEGDVITLSLDATKVKDGATYSGVLEVRDPYTKVSVDFEFVVASNTIPTATVPTHELVINGTQKSTILTLDDFFKDNDGDKLLYKASTKGSLVSASVNGNTLNIVPKDYGYEDIEISASDPRSASAKMTLKVLVRDGLGQADVYPSIVKDFLFVRLYEEQSADISIYNSSGALVYSSKDAHISPFAPHKVDLTSFDGGVYYVKVQNSKMNENYTIVKQ